MPTLAPLATLLLVLSSIRTSAALLSARFNYSWDTLPVFFHSANATGPWSSVAAREISRYAMATHEKNHGQGASPGMTQEMSGPEACRQINSVKNSTTTANLYYLNSVIDWQSYALHDFLVVNPDWRLKDAKGEDILLDWGDSPGRPWCFNLSVPELRELWIIDCLAATERGCDGCYIDRSNNMTQMNFKMQMTDEDADRFERAHMHTLSELNARLAEKDKFAVSNNQGLPAVGTTAMMFEDFAASEHCIRSMQTAAERGLAVQVHAGDYVDDGTNTTKNGCGHGDINSMSAFLISAGEHAYYHCAPGWSSDGTWPKRHDDWLGWRPEYDRPLGRPMGNGTKGLDGVWRRRFARGTYVEFDPEGGNGTIWWGDGTVLRGARWEGTTPKRDGCIWQSMASRFRLSKANSAMS